jgi:hypothetical protein
MISFSIKSYEPKYGKKGSVLLFFLVVVDGDDNLVGFCCDNIV